MDPKRYAAHSLEGQFSDLAFERRETFPQDFILETDYGIRHSDIYTMKAKFDAQSYPFILGHEIAIKVKAVDQEITNFKMGDLVNMRCLDVCCRRCC